MVELGDVLLGRGGRRSPDDVTLFVGGGTGASSGLGIQFAAVANAVYRATAAAGLGHQVPTEWFTEDRRP
jgi:alanine dehydrogenase